MAYWNIDSGDGNSLTEGIQLEIEARRIARRMANERGESVYLYEVGNESGESEVGYEEIEPEPVLLSPPEGGFPGHREDA